MKRFVVLLPVISGIAWGSTGVFVRKLYDDGMDSGTTLAIRMLIGTVLLFIYCYIKDKSLFKIKAKDIWILLVGGILGNFALSYFNIVSLNLLTMSFAATLLNTYPIIVIFMAAIIFKEKITRRKMLCAISVVFGCVLVSGILEETNLRWSLYGLIAGILAAFGDAIYSLCSKLAKERGYNSLTITFYLMLIVSIVSFPMADWTSVTAFVSANMVSNSIYLIVYAVCVALLPYLTFVYSLEYIEAGKATMLTTMEPISAMIFGALLFGETPTFLMILCMLITVGALKGVPPLTIEYNLYM